LSRDTISEGPLVAVLQQDFPSLVSMEDRMRQPGPLEKAQAYFAMMEEVSSEGADLVVLPETPWDLYLDRDFLQTETFPASDLRTVQYWRAVQSWGRKWHGENFSTYARKYGCSIVVGGVGLELFPTNVYPNEKKYNSAYVYGPEGDYPERYDKVHLMLFGEYVPFRYGRLHSLYLWLNSITPWGADGMEYSLTSGKEFRTFSMAAASQEGKTYDFGTPICYEDVLPYVGRRFARGEDGKKRIDFLVNISNDGWFNHSSELFQHLTICAFRAVENRVGVARSVNTGISGFIDPNGRIYDTVPRATTGYRVARVMVDERESLYTRWGDWFAIGCSLLAVMTLMDAVVVRRFVHLRKSTPEGAL
jgi:apolipoprotein N-acyltransferase